MRWTATSGRQLSHKLRALVQVQALVGTLVVAVGRQIAGYLAYASERARAAAVVQQQSVAGLGALCSGFAGPAAEAAAAELLAAGCWAQIKSGGEREAAGRTDRERGGGGG